MPEFKNSGTGYTEHPVGSDHFPCDKKEEDRAVHGGERTPGFSEESRQVERPNPHTKGGPQVY